MKILQTYGFFETPQGPEQPKVKIKRTSLAPPLHVYVNLTKKTIPEGMFLRPFTYLRSFVSHIVEESY